jgi:purine-nucleoside phosphorylase
MTANSPLSQAASSLVSELGRPDVGVILGSGLGAFADALADAKRVSYRDIAGMPLSSVAGHAGEWVQGMLGNVSVACLSGRAHAYEGHPVSDVVYGARLLAEVGCKTVFLTNAAGGLGAGFVAGDFMLITDHLNLTGKNPLAERELSGPRFVDMTQAYAPSLQAAARSASQRVAVTLREGVYAGLLGPSYETPAEIRMLATLGASAVGMSTVLETIALRQRGVEVGAISCITNLAAGISATLLSHQEVQQIATERRGAFVSLLREWILESRSETQPVRREISPEVIQAYLDVSAARTRKRLPLAASPVASVTPKAETPAVNRSLPLTKSSK